MAMFLKFPEGRTFCGVPSENQTWLFPDVQLPCLILVIMERSGNMLWDLFQAPNNFADRFLESELIVEFLCDIDDIAMGRA